MIGDILDDKYRIEKHLGAGGMGNVYLATHLGTTRVVAVKVIAPKWAADPQFLARFQREAQACGQLRHPNIVNVTDFGIANTRSGDMAYLVMELLDGETLSAFQKTHPRPSLPLVADLLDQIGLALEDAHRHGIVHRDLKPDNIWLEADGRGGYTVKVLDFGVAKMTLLGDPAPDPAPVVTPSPDAGLQPILPGDEMETLALEMQRAPQPGITRTQAEEAETVALASPPSGTPSRAFDGDSAGQTMPGSLIGTPAYMSPEQALGIGTDARSDIYSLAVVAYSLVCGQLPFTGKTSELVEFHRSGNPLPPASVRKIPRDVSDTILAGLRRDPANRPPSAIAFTRCFHNAVDAEFLALRRSKAFLLQHLVTFALLLLPIYPAILALTALLGSLSRKLLPAATVRMILVPLAAAGLFVFFDNLLRAAAAFIAVDEQARCPPFSLHPRLVEVGQGDPRPGADAGPLRDAVRAWLGGRRLPLAGDLRGGEPLGRESRPAVARTHDRPAVRGTRAGDSPSRAGRLRRFGCGQIACGPLANRAGRSARYRGQGHLVSTVCALRGGPAISL